MPRAFAGYFSGPVYSGGTGSYSPIGGGMGVFPWTTSSNSNPATGAFNYFSYVTDAPTPTVSTTTSALSGPLTAKFKWMPAYPGEPAPPSVIVVQNCQTSWGGDIWGTGIAKGVLNDGLGQTATSAPGATSGSCNGVKYTVQAPAADGSVTVICSPSASFSGTEGTNGGINQCGPSILYSANIYPVTINLTGGIGSSTAKHLLIGQQLTATLSTGPLSPTSWYWGASGGVAFKNYTASDAQAVYTPLGYETGNQLVCYFSQPALAPSIQCLVHLPVPAGATPTSGLDLTVSQSLTVEKPSAQLDVSIGAVTDLPNSTNPIGVQLQQFYTYPESGNAEGISWDGTLTTPAAYVVSGNYGSWNWTQLITAQRQEKNNGVYWQFAVNTTTPATIINGISILDGTYPYGYFWYPSDGTRTGNADSPYQPLDSSVAIREYDVSDSFNDYLMYLPPGSGSLPVPMKRNSWYWDFQATKNVSNIWGTSSMNAQWGFVGDFPAFPTWTFCATIGHLVYVAPRS